MKQNIKFIILLLFLISIFPILFWIIAFSIKPSNLENAEYYFTRDREEILNLADYLKQSSHSYITINISSLDEIKEEKVKKVFEILIKKKHYHEIVKRGNTICFIRWINMDSESGLAFSINGDDKPKISYLTKLEALSEKNWYYYVSDYDEYFK